MVEVIGMERLVADLNTLRAALPERLGQELYQEAEEIMTLAKEKYVPVDLGNLRDSGFVTPPEGSGEKITVTLGFGGPAAPYALVQHENMDFNHTTGGPKYLERPAIEQAAEMIPRIAGRLRVTP